MDTNTLYCGDNLQRLAQLPAESVDLIYLDPPFFSNRHYEVIWGDEAEVRSFEDRWQGGINVYIEWMRERAIELWRVLKPTGSLYLHCDWHASHYLKTMLDDIFGSNRFLNEIIWCYNVGGKSKKYWARKHDSILYYSKTKDWFFDGVSVGVKRETGTHSSGGRMGTDEEGRRYQDKLVKSSGKYYRYYLDDPKIPEDWWTDINSLQSGVKERLGYPTQKPEALLERIIRASSREGDIVLDPFCGCGTTLVVAQRFNRRWIGIDISPTAVELMKRRMIKVGATQIKLVGMPVSVEALKHLKPFEFQNWVIQRMNGTHSPRKSGDMGIDGFSFFLHEPIQVKQSEGIGRPVVDIFETAVQRSGKRKGFIIGFSFTRGAHEEVARASKALGLEIELLTVQELLRDVTSLITPVGGGLLTNVVIPPPRPSNTLPSAEDLIASNRRSA